MRQALDKDLILGELAHRELARRKMEYFIPYVMPSYKMGNFHLLLCRILDKIVEESVNKQRPRYVLTVPPRHGKSEASSVKMPANIFGRYPHMEIIGASYSTDLAVKMSRQIQKTMAEPAYRQLFPHINLSRTKLNTQTSEEFTIPGFRGSYKAAGVGAGITGRGADLLIIDDPIKDMKEADSQLVRDNVFDWFYSTAYTRLSAGAGVLVIQTRWHPIKDDTPVLTTKGWKTHGKLKEGDYVFGVDGNPVRVLGSTPPVWCDMEVVTLSETIVCSKDHVWATKTHPKNKLMELETQELVHKKVPRYLPKIKPLLYTKKELPIDPYWLGLWLGDGSAIEPTIRCGKKYTKHCETTSYSYKVRKCEHNDFVYSYTKQGIRKNLVTLGLLGNKHIPALYKTANVEARLALLAGLIDSDGDLCISGYRFSNSNKKLIEDVRELVIGLGFNCKRTYINTKKGSIGINGTLRKSDNLRLFFSPNIEIPCKVAYKQHAGWMKQHRTLYAQISTNAGWGRCIKTDAPDGLYLVGRTLIPTHNTSDLAGRLLNPEFTDGDTYTHINFPAIAEGREVNPLTGELFREEGDALDPERIPIEQLDMTKASIPSRIWAALYQQRPVELGGNIFKEEWIKIIEPEDFPTYFNKVIISCDMTFKDTDGTDYVVFQAWGQKKGDFYLLDQVRKRMDFVTTCKELVAFCNKNRKATTKLVEAKANGEAVISALKKHVFGIIPVDPKDSKEARAHSVSVLFQSGNVYVPNTVWIRDYISELTAFPTGAHDDQVDATSQALTYLAGSSLFTWSSKELGS